MESYDWLDKFYNFLWQLQSLLLVGMALELKQVIEDVCDIHTCIKCLKEEVLWPIFGLLVMYCYLHKTVRIKLL